MVSEVILKYMTQGGRGLYRFANLSKKQFCTSKTRKKQLSTNVLKTSTTHYYFARLTSVNKNRFLFNFIIQNIPFKTGEKFKIDIIYCEVYGTNV